MDEDDTKTVRVDGPDLAFCKVEDGTLEISDPDDQGVVYYLSATDAYNIGVWLCSKFGTGIVN